MSDHIDRILADPLDRLLPYNHVNANYRPFINPVPCPFCGYAIPWEANADYNANYIEFPDLNSAAMFFYSLATVNGRSRKTLNRRETAYMALCDQADLFSVPNMLDQLGTYYKSPVTFGEVYEQFFTGRVWFLESGAIRIEFWGATGSAYVRIKDQGTGKESYATIWFDVRADGVQAWRYEQAVGRMKYVQYVSHSDAGMRVLSDPGPVMDYTFF